MRSKNKKFVKLSRGQALLPLLIMIIIVLALGTSAMELSMNSVVIDRYFYEGLTFFYTVEATMENALLRLLRNPGYVGEDLQIDGVSCTIEVSGVTPRVVLASCDDGSQIKSMQAEVIFTDGVMDVGNMREVE